MRLGFNLGYTAPGTNPAELIGLAREAETLGYESAWTTEAWGYDAVSPLAWLGALTQRIKLGTAVMQLPGRSPANTAMTAATLDFLSGGRFCLGIGTSGPQVVEGWHGEAWGNPLGKTREYIEIVRTVLRHEKLDYQGAHYGIPLRGGTGLGRPLRLMAEPLRREIPIYVASIAPRAVRQTIEIADGWLPIFWSPERARNAFDLGLARKGFDVAPSVPAVLTTDIQSARDELKRYYAFYIGGMGPRGKNFYNDLFARYGFEAEAGVVQDHFLEGRRDEAVTAIPDAFVDEVALIGSVERMRDRMGAWRESGATTLRISTRDLATLRAVAEAAS